MASRAGMRAGSGCASCDCTRALSASRSPPASARTSRATTSRVEALRAAASRRRARAMRSASAPARRGEHRHARGPRVGERVAEALGHARWARARGSRRSRAAARAASAFGEGAVDEEPAGDAPAGVELPVEIADHDERDVAAFEQRRELLHEVRALVRADRAEQRDHAAGPLSARTPRAARCGVGTRVRHRGAVGDDLDARPGTCAAARSASQREGASTAAALAQRRARSRRATRGRAAAGRARAKASRRRKRMSCSVATSGTPSARAAQSRALARRARRAGAGARGPRARAAQPGRERRRAAAPSASGKKRFARASSITSAPSPACQTRCGRATPRTMSRTCRSTPPPKRLVTCRIADRVIGRRRGGR